MIRIAEKEISVNIQMKIRLEDGSSKSEFYVFDPGWSDSHVDPVTGQMAKLYDAGVREGLEISTEAPKEKQPLNHCGSGVFRFGTGIVHPFF